MHTSQSAAPPKYTTAIVVGAILVIVAVVVVSVAIQRVLPPATVYLNASPYTDGIDMFPVLGPSANGRYYALPDRTRCTVITDLDYYKIDSGPRVAFYKLDCDGKVGYVHADRVSRY